MSMVNNVDAPQATLANYWIFIKYAIYQFLLFRESSHEFALIFAIYK